MHRESSASGRDSHLHQQRMAEQPRTISFFAFLAGFFANFAVKALTAEGAKEFAEFAKKSEHHW